jgi:SAM-dependent methyltransferase
LIWRCPSARVLELYRKHLSGNHLEVGVGTGYFLDRSDFPTGRPRVALLDLNANCLDRTARRIARYAPEVYQANVLAPITIEARRFDSVCLNYVLHCLPGALPGKGIVFEHLKAMLNPGGVLFGSTVLRRGVHGNVPADMFMQFLNARRLFCNEHDELDGLVHTLEQHLTDVRIEVVGCVALFSGRRIP